MLRFINSFTIADGGLCTKNTSRALIERPYSCAPQAVGAVYDRPGFFVQSRVSGCVINVCGAQRSATTQRTRSCQFRSMSWWVRKCSDRHRITTRSFSDVEVFRFGLPAFFLLPRSTTRCNSDPKAIAANRSVEIAFFMHQGGVDASGLGFPMNPVAVDAWDFRLPMHQVSTDV